MPVITNLCVYPVKSMQGTCLQQATLTVRGILHDRNWMVVDEEGQFITQRDLPQLASISVSIDENSLKLSRTGSSVSVLLSKHHTQKIVTHVWGNRCEAFDEGNEVSGWLSSTTGKKGLRLVRFNQSYTRNVDPEYLNGEENAHTAFADGFPYLFTFEESLSMLNDHLAQSGAMPVEMDRFRPNIVVKGLQAFRENEIGELQSSDGTIRFGLRKPCKRCKVTTVDQSSGQIADPKEPLRTLTRMKTIPGKNGAYFGQNAILLMGNRAVIRLGDTLRTGSSVQPG